jgi:hypothetical protein
MTNDQETPICKINTPPPYVPTYRVVVVCASSVSDRTNPPSGPMPVHVPICAAAMAAWLQQTEIRSGVRRIREGTLLRGISWAASFSRLMIGVLTIWRRTVIPPSASRSPKYDPEPFEIDALEVANRASFHVCGITRRGFGKSGFSASEDGADRLGDDDRRQI